MINLSGQSPSPGSKSNDLDSLISFVVEKNSIDLSKITVLILGEIAFENSAFTANYNGTFSEYTEEANLIRFTFDPINNFSKDLAVSVKVHYKDEAGSDSKQYSFLTISDKPMLYFSNISNNDIIDDPIVIRLEFIDEIDGIDQTTINIKINNKEVVIDGVLNSFFNNYNSTIEAILNGYGVSIDHQDFFRDGQYLLEYQVADTNGVYLIGKLNFTVKLKRFVLPDVFPSYNFIGFINGMRKAVNRGDGKTVDMEWSKLISRVPKSEVFALIYYGTERLTLFDSLPKFIAKKDVTTFSYSKFTPGKAYYFAARGLETFANTLNFTGMTEVETGVYSIPSEISVSGLFDVSDLTLTVDDTSGYPESGLLVIKNSEVVKYSSITRATNTFNIVANGRGLNGSSIGTFVDGDEVKLFLSCQDSNTNILKATPQFEDGTISGREPDHVGVLVTDYTDNDKKFHQGFDYCGYHQPLPGELLKGIDDCGTYQGGEFNGARGLNLYDRMLNREEVLLEQVGEPVILLKRKWSGQMCDCITARTVHPKEKTCGKCFGTGFTGGFDQFSNLRRNDRRVLVRFKETQEDLELHMTRHMNVKFEPQCWTLPIPAIKDRDIIIRFDFSGDLEYFYEVLNVSKEKVIFGNFGRQNLSLKRLDKTDLINTFKYT